MNDFTILIEAYQRNWKKIHLYEDYKWIAIKHFQEVFDINAKNFEENLKEAFSKAKNLLDSGKYFPLGMLFRLVEHRPEETRELLRALYNEDVPLAERIIRFKQRFDEITKELLSAREISDWDKYLGGKKINEYQDDRAISVYLAFRYPAKYYIFKFTEFKKSANRLRYDFKVKKGYSENIFEFQRFCNQVNLRLELDTEFISQYKPEYNEYQDESHHLLTQDFVFAVANYIFDTTEIESSKKFDVLGVTEIESKDAHLKDGGESTFKPKKGVDFEGNAKAQKKLGSLGELWVMDYERKRLNELGRKDLAQKVQHMAIEQGDGLGYDILSFNENGSKRYIEVKTTSGNRQTPFYVSSNELNRSLDDANQYYIYRVYDYNRNANSARLEIIHGSLLPLCKEPTEYKVTLSTK
jgi:hypothetical protein